MNCKPQAQAQAQQPQKCPRCESMNTKFCYYNNYSLSQPRYFCKSCRRYWTQGGTLRNVRVGGASRKPKRPKSSSSSSSAASAGPTSPPPPPQQAEEQQHLPPVISSAPSSIPLYLSPMAAIHSLNQPQPFNQMNLLSGFAASTQPFYHHMGVMKAKGEDEDGDVYAAEQVQLIQSSVLGSSGGSASTTHRHDWTTESFININNNNNSSVHHRGSDASLWSTTMSIVSTSGNSQALNHSNDASTSVGGSFSLIPSPQWPHLPEYHPPP